METRHQKKVNMIKNTTTEPKSSLIESKAIQSKKENIVLPKVPAEKNKLDQNLVKVISISIPFYFLCLLVAFIYSFII